MEQIRESFLVYNYVYINIEKQLSHIFRKKDIEFKFIKQRFNGWELYFTNSDVQNLKLDFTLELFAERNMVDIIKEGKKELNHEEILDYCNNLIFNTGTFLVENNRVKTYEFLKWHKENANDLYRKYIEKVGK